MAGEDWKLCRHIHARQRREYLALIFVSLACLSKSFLYSVSLSCNYSIALGVDKATVSLLRKTVNYALYFIYSAFTMCIPVSKISCIVTFYYACFDYRFIIPVEYQMKTFIIFIRLRNFRLSCLIIIIIILYFIFNRKAYNSIFSQNLAHSYPQLIRLLKLVLKR